MGQLEGSGQLAKLTPERSVEPRHAIGLVECPLRDQRGQKTQLAPDGLLGRLVLAREDGASVGEEDLQVRILAEGGLTLIESHSGEMGCPLEVTAGRRCSGKRSIL